MPIANPYTENSFNSSDLKTILHSKRANIYYLQYCRVMQKDGRVLYLTENDKENLYYNIPIANTTSILLGTGTSITQAAMRMLAQAGVLVGFCGGGGTPLFMGTEKLDYLPIPTASVPPNPSNSPSSEFEPASELQAYQTPAPAQIDIEWLTPQSEYRPTEYVQGWLSWWWDEGKRLQAAKILQFARVDFLTQVWARDKELKTFGFDSQTPDIADFLHSYREQIGKQCEVMHLLQLEARMTKQLYKLASDNTKQSGFTREHDGVDKANGFLNHGNYLAYGLGATTAWVLGIPHGFAVMHGKTRRGALVFDIADIIKDAIVLPLAFICASENATEQEFRQECLNYFTAYKALDAMFDTVKNLALKTDWEA